MSRYEVKFKSGELAHREAYSTAVVFEYLLSYLRSEKVGGPDEVSHTADLVLRVRISLLQALKYWSGAASYEGNHQVLEKVTWWWLCQEKLSGVIENQRPGSLRVIDCNSLPPDIDASRIDYPPKEPFIVEVSRRIGF